MAFQPADSLKNRTFLGLIIAQFLAGFNDQAIHASAMFFALHRHALTEAEAISLMPILFFAPWAIFCTLAGHFADRYSKTTTLRIWKFAEIIISLILIGGFILGVNYNHWAGPWVVLSTVFLMGMHAAFFAPAKYGAMPEILQPHILSRGNGVLESTTFLAAILGTVSGGALSWWFSGREVWIGVVLLVLSLVGSVASLLIARLPPANPERPFPVNLFKPLARNLKILLNAKPLALSVLGIAFFIFMVAYMRQTMYMHGETRNPRWDEFRTSLVVAAVALGVGLGAPLAGQLSGGKIELGMVPLGSLGMIAATVVAGLLIDNTTVLVAALVVIGFFSGFYMVPLYTLLQHRAPKASKGDLVATSNFINVVGAMAASLLFFLLVQGARLLGVSPEIPQTDRYTVGTLAETPEFDKGHVTKVVVTCDGGLECTFKARTTLDELDIEVIDFDDNLFDAFSSGLKQGDRVIVSYYELNRVVHYFIRPESQQLKRAYDNEGLPRFLFFGAALMTLFILVLLVAKLPDFFVRMVFWLRSIDKFRVKAVGMHHLPTQGPVILATNCDRLESSLQLVSATDRATLFVLWENPEGRVAAPLVRAMAVRSNIVAIDHADANAWHNARQRAQETLAAGNLLAVTADGHAGAEIESLLHELQKATGAPIVPVHCGQVGQLESATRARIRVAFGAPTAANASLAEIRAAIRQLGEAARDVDTAADHEH